MTIEYHRSANGATIVCEARYARRATRCHDDWRGSYADGQPKANRTPCLVGRRIEAGQPLIYVYTDDDGSDSTHRTYHAECYMRTYRIEDRAERPVVPA